MRFNSNTAFIIVGILFIITVLFKFDIEKNKVDITTYYINEKDPKTYLFDQKDIFLYNEKENTILKISFYYNPKRELYKELEIISVGQIDSNLREQICIKSDISVCIKSNLKKDKYIQEDKQKIYFIDKDFGMKIFNTVKRTKNNIDN